jgi:hypothetical protein
MYLASDDSVLTRVDLLNMMFSELQYIEKKLYAWKVGPEVYLNSSTLMLFPIQVK